MKKYILLLIPLLFLMAQCHKTSTPEPEPPTFQNTFSCFVNGKFWQAYQPLSGAVISWTSKLQVLYDSNPKDGYIWIQAKRDTLDIKETITIGTKFGQASVGKYVLSPDLASFRLTNCEINVDSTKSWIEIVKVDTAQRVISGKFEAKAQQNSCENASITSGSFEVKY